MAGLHSLKRSTSQKRARRVGRGGKRGKTSGHGHKGQKQHGRHGIRPEIRDFVKKFPKMRGHGINRSRTVNDSRISYIPVNLSELEKHFKAGDTVTPAILFEKNVVRKRAGKVPPVKILARGDLSKKLEVQGCAYSTAAKEAIEGAGGSLSA